MSTDPAAKLSRDQRHILENLLRHTEARPAGSVGCGATDAPSFIGQVRLDGAAWLEVCRCQTRGGCEDILLN
jgi:hypothetical protein